MRHRRDPTTCPVTYLSSGWAFVSPSTIHIDRFCAALQCPFSESLFCDHCRHNSVRPGRKPHITPVSLLHSTRDIADPFRTSLHSLDSALSLLLTVLTSALAYPPTLAFGHVLLQTAPPATNSQIKLLRRAMKDVTGDSRVLGVGTLRCWSIGATNPPVEPSFSSNPASAPGSAPSSPRVSSISSFSPVASPTRLDFSSQTPLFGLAKGSDAPNTPLVVSLIVHVHPDASDRDVLDVTKQVWTKVNAAVGQRGARQKDGGEITISVKRGWDGETE